MNFHYFHSSFFIYCLRNVYYILQYDMFKIIEMTFFNIEFPFYPQIHKKFILPPGTTVTGLSVIDGVSIMTQIKNDDDEEHLQQHYHCDLQDPSETGDSNDDDDDNKIAVSLVAPVSSILSESDGASSPNSLNGSTSQQLTAQVGVVQSQDDMEPHYITVTGEIFKPFYLYSE